MKIKKKFFLLCFAFLILFTSKAYAYLDPGTGAHILQAIIAFLGAVLFYLGYPITYMKKVIQKIKDKIKKKKE